MALTRARVIGGDAAFGREVSEAIAGIIARPRDQTAVAAETRAMRDLIAQEKGDQDPWDLKLAAGGLTDLDFLAQALVLAHAYAHRELIGRPTPETLAEAARAGLLNQGDAQKLLEASALLTDVFQWQRLMITGRFDPKAVAPAILKRLAAVAGQPDAERLLDRLNETRAGVREIFSRVLAGSEP